MSTEIAFESSEYKFGFLLLGIEGEPKENQTLTTNPLKDLENKDRDVRIDVAKALFYITRPGNSNDENNKDPKDDLEETSPQTPISKTKLNPFLVPGCAQVTARVVIDSAGTVTGRFLAGDGVTGVPNAQVQLGARARRHCST
jgi:hypothetical protein